MRKPAQALPAEAGRFTSIRVNILTHEAMERIRQQLVEWFLGHPDKKVREQALDLSLDRALRIVLASFARDYRIPLEVPK